MVKLAKELDVEIPEYKVSCDQTKNMTEKTQEYIQDLCIDAKISTKVKKISENYDVKQKQCTETDRKFESESVKEDNEVKCERQSPSKDDVQKENDLNS